MSGAYAALFTPYDAKGRVDADTVARIMDYGYANGLRGFYLTGTTGEWWLLSTEERKAVYQAAAKANRGRGKLIAHVGANCTDDSVELARYAADVGHRGDCRDQKDVHRSRNFSYCKVPRFR